MNAGGVLLDITRTVSRAGQGALTGIDRVERAWIDAALAGRWGAAWFIARCGSGLHAVPAEAMRGLLAALDGRAPLPRLDLRGRVSLKSRMPMRQIESGVRRAAMPVPRGLVYANVGHSNLSLDGLAAIRAMGARRCVVMIHDVIPLDHPAFARPGGPEKMRVRLSAAASADVVIYNSGDTQRRAALHAILPPGIVAPLGVDPALPIEAAPHGGFVVLGTIEPRKNHALLLDLWASMGAAAPKLHIIGRRGWMNADVFARLDRKPPHVIEHGSLDDAAVRPLLAGASAMLFPSFAEGYGLPLAEALSLHVPVIASDLPALREVGGDLPIWCAPDDPAAWTVAIRLMQSPELRAERARQIRDHWHPPTWEDHFALVDSVVVN